MNAYPTKMRPTFNLPSGEDTYSAALEGLVRVDRAVMRRARREGRSLPLLYQSGVRYKQEGRGIEEWMHPFEIIERGFTDCNNLAAWRVAELRESGEDPNAVGTVYRTGPTSWHAIVTRGNGITEDPSRILGMGKDRNMEFMGNDCAPDGRLTGAIEDEWMGADPSPSDEISWTVEPKPGGGFKGTIRVPLWLGQAAFVKREGSSKQEATNAAIKAAGGLLDNPAVAAAIPAPARFALELARSDKAKEIAKNILGGASSVVKSIGSWF